MITLLSIIAILGIYSAIRISQKSKLTSKPFNPFKGNSFEFLTFIAFAQIAVAVLIMLILEYLP
jgi:hypothetical protein